MKFQTSYELYNNLSLLKVSIDFWFRILGEQGTTSSNELCRGRRKNKGYATMPRGSLCYPVVDPEGGAAGASCHLPPVQCLKSKKTTRFRAKYALECVI